MQLSFNSILMTLFGEVYSRRNAIFVIFTIVSLSVLAVGTVWPKRYTSTAIIIADDSNILQPLMEGTAETTRVRNHADNAREILFGDKIISQVLDDAGWLGSKPSELEQEHIKEDIRNRVKVNSIGRNLISIKIRDSDPMRAYITVKRMAELFIEEGERSKINESQAAFDFIEKQVNEYLRKLILVEEQLEVFRSNNPDARPGTDTEVSDRIRRLTTELERTHLSLRETLIRLDSLKEQLSGEAAITISMSKEGQYRSKISIFQTRLETLRLDYRETYPDIVRLKHQIDDLKSAMNAEIKQRKSAKLRSQNKGSAYIDEAILLNPLYQELRSDASSTETKIATLQARISELNNMLQKEYDRAKRIHGGEAALSKLTRDYQVNQDIYQDLLRRLERARVSKSLDEQNQGLTFKLQEPAKIPLIPTGIRFLHFMLAGIVLGIGIPIALIYMMIQIDPKIRFTQIISEDIGVPVLAEIYAFTTKKERKKEKINNFILVVGYISVLTIYGYVGWLKQTGQL